MIKKAFFFLAIYLNGYECSYAQKSVGFFNGGISIFFPWQQGSDETVVLPAFTVEPGFWIFHDEKISLSLSFPISFGATAKSDAFIGVDLPALMKISLGSATGLNKKAKMGVKLGAGAAYIIAENNYESVPPDKTHAEFFGYRISADICFKDTGDKVTPALVLSFGKRFANTKYYVVGIGILLLLSN